MDYWIPWAWSIGYGVWYFYMRGHMSGPRDSGVIIKNSQSFRNPMFKRDVTYEIL